ncbi:hypothetical protein NDU88_005282 [Pleurodeles waltl]|uniref:Uncharacterized protein n=1 Tax=Pleurodeles waltl TaxID=8319 RepID=A0AAV7UIG8_PLEWA|nr:hypothetical protein NDU88_005282 [Pleurodeles waltl]
MVRRAETRRRPMKGGLKLGEPTRGTCSDERTAPETTATAEPAALNGGSGERAGGDPGRQGPENCHMGHSSYMEKVREH